MPDVDVLGRAKREVVCNPLRRLVLPVRAEVEEGPLPVDDYAHSSVPRVAPQELEREETQPLSLIHI